MQNVIIVVHLIIVLALVGVVLLQRSEGGGLGMGGGGGGGGVSGLMTGRGQANALTRATAILAAGFFVTSLTLSVLAGLNRAPRSILDGAQPAAPIGAPAVPQSQPGQGQGGVLDQLQRLQDTRPAPPAPSGAPQAPQSR